MPETSNADWAISEARETLARWDAERGGEGIYSTERTAGERGDAWDDEPGHGDGCERCAALVAMYEARSEDYRAILSPQPDGTPGETP